MLSEIHFRNMTAEEYLRANRSLLPFGAVRFIEDGINVEFEAFEEQKESRTRFATSEEQVYYAQELVRNIEELLRLIEDSPFET